MIENGPAEISNELQAPSGSEEAGLVTPPDEEAGNNEFLLFPHRELLVIGGEEKECFYCGSRRHKMSSCPSKGLSLRSAIFSKLGHFSVDKLKEIFLQVFTNPERFNDSLANLKEADMRIISESNESLAAYHVFFDLTEIFQLRFLKHIWRTDATSWSLLKKSPESRQEGGPVWLALDCLRTGQIERAGYFLEAVQDKNLESRVFAIRGLALLEKGMFLESLYYLERAKEKTLDKIGQMHLVFLLARVHELLNDLPRAEQKVREIILLDSYCMEAHYYQLILQIKGGMRDDVSAKIKRVIAVQPEFFLYSLIDPRFSPAKEIIDSLLLAMLEEVSNEAKNLVREVQSKGAAVTRLIEADPEMSLDNNTFLNKMSALAGLGSYLAYAECKDIASLLINRYQSLRNSIKAELQRQDSLHAEKLENLDAFWKASSVKMLYNELPMLLQSEKAKLEQASEMLNSDCLDDLVAARELYENMAKRAGRLNELAAKMAYADNMIHVLKRFGKSFLVFEAIMLVLGLFGIPLILWGLNQFWPSASWSLNSSIEGSQNKLFLISSIMGLIVSTFIALKDSR